MPWNSTAMGQAAAALQTNYPYLQLHSADAGTSYTTAVIAGVARQVIPWSSPTGLGTFGLSSQMNFTGLTPNQPVYSGTVWSASTGGVCGGQFPLAGDGVADVNGDYSVTGLDNAGSAS